MVDRLHGPIGLDIGAESPEEIALAAAAIWQLEQDQRGAMELKGTAPPADSPWARAGRMSALRRSR